MMRVLVVEDSKQYQEMISKCIPENVVIKILDNADDMLNNVLSFRPDLIVMDINLPGKDGFLGASILKSSEQTKKIPIIFLSARTTVEDKILGLQLGAEDYITKPFDGRELRARIDSKLKKFKTESENDSEFRKGVFLINVFQQKVWLKEDDKDIPIDLSRMEFKLFLHLIKNEERVVSREEIHNVIWSSHVHISERTVDSHIRSIRTKIKPYGYLIKSEYGIGYRFSFQHKSKNAA